MTDTLAFYNKIENWILEQYRESNQDFFIVGISAPQGSGKTTLTNHLVDKFTQKNISSLALSIDDFYLTSSQQKELATKFPNNPYLQQRGYPGTHDINLGNQVLEGLSSAQEVLIPRYDKSAFLGKGDRHPITNWKKQERPVQILLFEGWMLGFKKTIDSQVPTSADIWNQIDDSLKNYKDWITKMHSFIYLEAEDLNNIIDWRLEAEQKMKACGLSGMTDQETVAYIKKFIPAYTRYSPLVLKNKDLPSCLLHKKIGKNRLPRP